MISQTAEYALRAVIHLAKNQTRAQTTHQIAASTRVPIAYLSKVLQGLARAGIIHSQRGLGGGFTLLIPSDQLSVYTVIQSVDPIKRIISCPLGNEDHQKRLCPLHRRLDNAIALVENSFRETMIEDLLYDDTSNADIKIQE
jgi:Rrf2 family protein